MAVWSIVKVSELEGAKRLDAEYYQPKYLEVTRTLCHFRPLKDYTRRIIHPTEIKRAYEDRGYPFLLSQNVRDNILDFSQSVFISEETAKLISKNKVEPGDVLMIRTGDIGKAAPYLGEPKNLYASAHVLVIKTKGISGAYLATFFNTKYGSLVLQRGHYGALQPEIAPSYVSTAPIPRFSNGFEKEIESKIAEAHKTVILSESLYLQAEQMVLEELGWDTLDLSQPKWWTAPLSGAREVHRLDAEHFQPKYDKLIAHLEKTGKAKPLGEIATYIKRGLQPRYVEGGDVLVINSRYVGERFINTEQAERTDVAFWRENAKAQARKYDVVMNSTGWGTIGRTNCVLHEQKTVVDNHVTIIRAKETVCNPVYLAVYLNSKPGLMQTNKWLSGSSGQIELYPADIVHFLIYLPSEKFQQQVADLVQQSYQARQKAKALLEEAKAKVEAAIEKKASPRTDTKS